MKISVYTLPYPISNECDKINSLFNEGLEELHLRKPTSTKAELRKMIKQINPKFYNRITIHQHYKLAEEFGLKGIHVKQTYFKGFFGKLLYLINYKNKNYDISTTVDPVHPISKDFSIYNEIHVGPIYQKISETNINARLSNFELKREISVLNKPCSIFGGVDTDNFNVVKRLAPKGIILQSSIWKSSGIVNAFKTFQLINNKKVKTDLISQQAL